MNNQITELSFDFEHWFKVNKMQANPDKFQVLAVGKNIFDKKHEDLYTELYTFM